MKSISIELFPDPCEDKFHHMSKQLCCVKAEGHATPVPSPLAPPESRPLEMSPGEWQGTLVAFQCCSFRRGLHRARQCWRATLPPIHSQFRVITRGKSLLLITRTFLCRAKYGLQSSFMSVISFDPHKALGGRSDIIAIIIFRCLKRWRFRELMTCPRSHS